ncbi:MAG: AAA family ATPase [Planctomycetia bacterium]|jgi:predicted ATP-dependent endonuclease of OLD family
MKITSLKLADVWSFRRDHSLEIEFDPKVTVLIGKNNSGKSNILKAIDFLLGPKSQIDYQTQFHNYSDNSITPTPEMELQGLASHAEFTLPDSVKANPDLQDNNIRFLLTPPSSNEPFGKKILINNRPINQPINRSNNLANQIKDANSFMSAWRSLKDPVDQNKTIVTRLHEIRSPDNISDSNTFDRIEEFFQKLTGLKDAKITPKNDGSVLSIRYQGRLLPINSFGDGIFHVLRMAFEFLRKENHIFLIEEPETHLHPELIRILIREAILENQNDNQFIITTHSPVVLDELRAHRIYRIEYNGEYSTKTECSTPDEVYKVLDQLDVRPSDLLQANCVIWVEGPTDRLFLRHCIRLLNEDFLEGRHYQFAYYGGRLLAHHSAEENDEDDEKGFINIFKLCRHTAVVADSDKDRESDDINETKKRLQREVTSRNGFFWVTAGREIENYIPNAVLQATYKELIPGKENYDELILEQFGKIDEVLKSWCPKPEHGEKGKVDYGKNKTTIMPSFLKYFSKEHFEDNFDLKEKVEELIAFIEKANQPQVPGGEED